MATFCEDPFIQELVAKFVEARRQDRRTSIDTVLDACPELPNRGETRTAVLEAVASRTAASWQSGPPSDDAPDELPTLEGYDLIDWIGAGGMGTVFEAYQQATGRRVAIKLMRPGLSSSESARRRFEREVELAARLQHPHIVSILDSGLQRARYYYVMDFVDGQPLDKALPSEARDPRHILALLKTICETVDYAHQRGVLHRDLKPSNILVDSHGQPHLLDFGLAKAIRSDSQAVRQVSISQPGELIGTLGYMPPEQARGDQQETSVRSDVYSLGAIVYQLITGRLPCETGGPLVEVLDRIAYRVPVAPSIHRQRRDADLDAILLKALEKAPSDRYATAGEMAEDIGRYLADEPIRARRSSAITHVSRWVRRNRALSAVGVGSAALILAIAGFSFLRVRSDYDRIVQTKSVADEATALFDRELSSYNPLQTKGSEVTLAGLCDKVRESLRIDPPDSAEVEAAVRARLAHNYRELGLYTKADEELTAALDLQKRLFDDPHAELAQSYHDLAAVRWYQARYPEARQLYSEALRMRSTLFGEEHADTALTRNHLAACLDKLGDHDAAEAMFRQVLATRTRLFGDEHLEVAFTLNNLATSLRSQERYSEAEELFRRALEMIRRLAGDDHAYVSRGLHNIATCLVHSGGEAEAEELLLAAITMKKEQWGEDHPSVAESLGVLAELKFQTDDCAAADYFGRQALEIQKLKLPEGHVALDETQALLKQIEHACPRTE